jgi:NDP-mannose synthase
MTNAGPRGAAGAVVLAGGKGTRLWPYTAVLPKPLMPLADMPVLELVLRQLHFRGINRVVLAVNHLHHLVKSFFGQGDRLGIEILYSIEDEPMGTAAPLTAILEHLQDDFLILNGDLLTDFDFSLLLKSHVERSADLTVATQKRKFQVEFGVIDRDESGRITGITEKPSVDHWVAMGIYAANRKAIERFLPKRQYVDMPTVIQGMISDGGRVFAHHQDCIWLDIGRPEDYAAAQALFEQDRSRFLPPS